MIANVKGQFPKISGALTLDDSDLAKSSVEATIEAASIETRDSQRDAPSRCSAQPANPVNPLPLLSAALPPPFPTHIVVSTDGVWQLAASCRKRNAENFHDVGLGWACPRNTMELTVVFCTGLPPLAYRLADWFVVSIWFLSAGIQRS